MSTTSGIPDFRGGGGARLALVNREATPYDRLARDVRRGAAEDELASLAPESAPAVDWIGRTFQSVVQQAYKPAPFGKPCHADQRR